MELKFIRLVTGEDLISQIEPADPNKITLIDPYKIIYMFNESVGVVSVNLLSWVFPKITKTTNFVIKESDILAMADASSSITQYYINNKIKQTQSMQNGDNISSLREPSLRSGDMEDEFEEEEINQEAIDMVDDFFKNISNKGKLH